MSPHPNIRSVMLAGFAVLLAACGGGGGSDPAAPQGDATGTLSGGITDAAIDEVSAVNLRVTALELRLSGAAENDWVEIDLTDPVTGDPLAFDLIQYQQGEVFTLFENEQVPAGRYEHARLLLEAPAQTPGQCNGADPRDGSYVELAAGGEAGIFVPSGSNNGVRLVTPFDVPVNGTADIVIDFDLRQALHRPTAHTCYFLRPAYRVVASVDTGDIAGVVDSALLEGGMCSDVDPATGNAVYVYEGFDAVPGDIDAVDDGEAAPVATSSVSYDPAAGNTGQGSYRVAFLRPGDYTVAFTCSADLERLPVADAETVDEQEADDDLMLQLPRNVTVTPGQTVESDFVPTP